MSQKTYTLLQFEVAEIEEIKRYIRLKGVKLGHDPMDDQTEYELCCEWIDLYAPEFRRTHPVKDNKCK